MKFDPFNWNEVKPNEKVFAGQGLLRVRCSAPSPLYIEAQGVEALCGVGTAFEVETSEAVSFRVDAPKGVRVFVHSPEVTSIVAAGEVFTNIDRMPDESGNLLEVRRALRQLEIERRAVLREIRAERAAFDASRAPADPDPVIEPEADPAQEVKA